MKQREYIIFLEPEKQELSFENVLTSAVLVEGIMVNAKTQK